MKAGLSGLEIVTGDASLGASYEGLAPVDLVVISGVFGHLSTSDRLRLIDFTRQLCHTGTGMVWTSHLSNHGPAEWLRRAFLERRFEELEHELVPGDDFHFTVTRSSYTGAQQPFDPHEKIFTFGSSRAEREGTAVRSSTTSRAWSYRLHGHRAGTRSLGSARRGPAERCRRRPASSASAA